MICNLARTLKFKWTFLPVSHLTVFTYVHVYQQCNYSCNFKLIFMKICPVYTFFSVDLFCIYCFDIKKTWFFWCWEQFEGCLRKDSICFFIQQHLEPFSFLYFLWCFSYTMFCFLILKYSCKLRFIVQQCSILSELSLAALKFCLFVKCWFTFVYLWSNECTVLLFSLKA